MDLTELESALTAAGIPKGDYSIGKLVENTYVVLCESRRWKTFFFEKGARNLEAEFSSEDEACRHMYQELVDPYRRA